MYCPNCGKQQLSNANFCTHCGKSVAAKHALKGASGGYGAPVVAYLLGGGICGVGLLLQVYMKTSPVPIMVLLPLGLGLMMWSSATERYARIGVLAFAVGWWVALIGMMTDTLVLSLIALIPTVAGVFTWSCLKD